MRRIAGWRSPFRRPWNWKFWRVVIRSERPSTTSSASRSIARYWSAVSWPAGILVRTMNVAGGVSRVRRAAARASRSCCW